MDKALVFGTKDCRFESCQGQLLPSALHAPWNSYKRFSKNIGFNWKGKGRWISMHSVFEGIGTHFLANRPAIAQLVEHLTVECCSNQMVPGSMPGGRIFYCATSLRQPHAQGLWRMQCKLFCNVERLLPKIDDPSLAEKDHATMHSRWLSASQMTLWPSG